MTRFADLVFHVLAHVPSRHRLAASVYFPAYVQWCEEHLGTALDRPLGKDAATLSRLLSHHELLAQIQLLACLFPTPEAARVVDEYELDALPMGSLVHARVLTILRGLPRDVVELLRCSVALEYEHWIRLPEASVEPSSSFRASLVMATSIAPHLSKVRVCCARPLGLRGRAFDSLILVGAVEDTPQSCCPSMDHATLQAAHEATVLEVRSQVELPFLQLEHTALTVLRVRARNTRWEEAHGRWLSHLRLDEFGGPEKLELNALTGHVRDVARRVLSASD